MNLEVRKEGEIVCVTLANKKLDSTNSTEFKGQIIDLINQGGIYLLLNLTFVEFVDSSGLGALISVLKTLKQCKGVIVICETKPAVQNLFKITRIDLVIDVCLNEKQGLEDINKKKNITCIQ